MSQSAIGRFQRGGDVEEIESGAVEAEPVEATPPEHWDPERIVVEVVSHHQVYPVELNRKGAS